MPRTLKRTHIYQIDRAKMSAVVTGCNPTRRYIRGEAFEGDETAHTPVIVQAGPNGQNYFFDDGGVEMSAADVPQYILNALTKDPLRSKGQSIEQVMRYCPICPEPENAIASGQYEGHLLDHLKSAGIAKAVVAEDTQDQAPALRRRPRARKVKGKKAA